MDYNEVKIAEKCKKEEKDAVISDPFTGIYGEIAAQIDSETAEKIYRMLHGQIIAFPQRLYNPEYVRSFIRKNAKKYSVRELSVLFGYSNRRIRQFIAEEKRSEELLK